MRLSGLDNSHNGADVLLAVGDGVVGVGVKVDVKVAVFVGVSVGELVGVAVGVSVAVAVGSSVAPGFRVSVTLQSPSN